MYMRLVKAFFRRMIAMVKLSIIKIFHLKHFQFKGLELVSFTTRFTFEGDGEIVLGKNIGTRRNVEFKVSPTGSIKIGEGCFFNNNCMLVSYKEISIGNKSSFGPNVLFYDHDHDFRSMEGIKSSKYKTGSIVIGNNVWVGANTVILRDTVIGDNCVIGAGAILQGEYEPDSVIVPKRENTIRKYNSNS